MKHATALSPGDTFEVTVADGSIYATVDSIRTSERATHDRHHHRNRAEKVSDLTFSRSHGGLDATVTTLESNSLELEEA